MNGRAPYEYLLANGNVVGASASNQVISKNFPITEGGSKYLVVGINCSGVTVGTGITAKLQSGINDTYFDSKTASIAGNGWTFIKLNINNTSDQTYLPLLAAGRVVISSGSGDAATIVNVTVLQEL